MSRVVTHMKITKTQLRRLIREAVEDNTSHFADLDNLEIEIAEEIFNIFDKLGSKFPDTDSMISTLKRAAHRSKYMIGDYFGRQ